MKAMAYQTKKWAVETAEGCIGRICFRSVSAMVMVVLRYNTIKNLRPRVNNCCECESNFREMEEDLTRVKK